MNTYRLKSLSILIALSLLFSFSVAAQDLKPPAGQEARHPICNEESAISIVDQQVEEAKKIDQPRKQIPVMIRAADLLWSRRESTARKTLSDAFDIAEQYFKDKGDEASEQQGLRISYEDLRFMVMRTIARHDAAWAKKLATRIGEETKRDAEEKAKTGSAKNQLQRPGEEFGRKLLSMARDLLTVDRATALTLARNSFVYPLTHLTASFLFELGKTDRRAADEFYRAAVKNYQNAAIEDFLFLSAYPFAMNRALSANQSSYGFTLPENFAASAGLQQLFIEAILLRAEANANMPDPAVTDGRTVDGLQMPETARLVIALTRLEPLVAEQQPAYLERLINLKQQLNAKLTTETRASTTSVLNSRNRFDEPGGFQRNLDDYEREANPKRRDSLLAFALMNAPTSEPTDRLISLAGKVADETLRNQLLHFIYFKNTQKAIKDEALEEAAQLAGKIDRLDLRAYLTYEIAAASLKKTGNGGRAGEVLSEVAQLAYKSDNTGEKARTLLGVVHLFAKFDRLRAFEVMAEAVKTINRIENADFSSTAVHQMIKGDGFSSFYSFTVEGFSLEKSFRLLASLDFDGALSMAKNLEERSQRTIAVIAVAAICLENAGKLKKSEKRPEAPKGRKEETSDHKKPASDDQKKPPTK